MKVLISILIGLLVVGCGKKKAPAPQPDAEYTEDTPNPQNETPSKVSNPFSKFDTITATPGKIIGSYENRSMSEQRYTFKKNGKFEVFDGEELWHGRGFKWHISNTGEIEALGYRFKITDNGNLLCYNWSTDTTVEYKRVKETKPTTETKEPPANVGKELKPEDVIGSYEAGLGGITFRFVLLEGGVVENYFNGIKEPEDAKWKILGAEVHIEKGKPDGTVIVNKIEPNGDLTVFARIRNGKREDFQNRTYKKIKSEKETPSKGEEQTSPLIVLEGKSPDTLAAQLVPPSPGINEIKVEHDGQTRRLIITAPKTFSRQNLYPILFCFHGAGGKADGPSKRWSPHSDKRGLIVISAEAVQPQAKWNFTDKFHAEEHDDVRFILKVVEALIASQVADPKTIYATGYSSGGLFCYRLAKETTVFAALSPMSCGMVKGAHDPDQKTKFVPILQVIGDQDKSFNGSQNKVTMYSASKRIDVWRKFNQCGPNPVVLEKGKEIVVYTYASQAGIEVALCQVKGQGHFIRRDLRDISDSLALDFLLKHKINK